MLERFSVEKRPFVRFRATGVFDNYAELVEGFPQKIVERYPIGESLCRMRGDYLRDEMTNLPPAWRELMTYLDGPEFLKEARQFSAPFVTERYHDNPKYWIKPQLVVCHPQDKPHRIIGPHVDTERTLFVVEVFFPDPQDTDESGGFDYYATEKPTKLVPGGVRADESTVRLVDTAPYRANTGCGFLNSRESVHSSGLRNPSKYPRRYLAISGHVKRALFRR